MPALACREREYTVLEMPMLEINIPEMVAEVTEVFQRYERALVANDVEALDALFWDNPKTLRFGIAENPYC